MYDVAIVGGGPAGCAVALSVRVHAPSLSIVLVDAAAHDAPRVGETLSPPATRILRHLGLWESFVAQQHRPSYGTASLWGSAVPRDNDFILAARGNGWHLDRAAFDAMLVAQAEVRGVDVRRGERITDAVRADGAWDVTFDGGRRMSARFLVDATGSSARIARIAGARRIMADRLVGFARFFDDGPPADARTIVEAFSDGWWYTAALPGKRRVAACMTDGDVARRLELESPAGWSECLASTTRVSRLLRGAQTNGPLVARAARSQRLEPAASLDGAWLAAGDAASTFDPLSSQGITKALRGGVFGGYAIGDLLARRDGGGIERYQRFVAEEYASYLRTRATYYGAERRWTRHLFWRRRHETLNPAET